MYSAIGAAYFPGAISFLKLHSFQFKNWNRASLFSLYIVHAVKEFRDFPRSRFPPGQFCVYGSPVSLMRFGVRLWCDGQVDVVCEM